MSTTLTTRRTGRRVADTPPTPRQQIREDHARTCPLGVACFGDRILSVFAEHRADGPALIGDAAAVA